MSVAIAVHNLHVERILNGLNIRLHLISHNAITFNFGPYILRYLSTFSGFVLFSFAFLIDNKSRLLFSNELTISFAPKTWDFVRRENINSLWKFLLFTLSVASIILHLSRNRNHHNFWYLTIYHVQLFWNVYGASNILAKCSRFDTSISSTATRATNTDSYRCIKINTAI